MRKRSRLTIAISAGGALLALNAILVLAQPGRALSTQLSSYFLGPRMIRAEVILKDAAGLHDYRLDRGRIRSVSGGTITLLEADGTVVPIPVAANAQITLNGKAVPLSALRRGFHALTIRDRQAPATTVRARR